MRIVLFILIFNFCFSNLGFSQFQKAEIGVNGLTCSLCVRSVERALLELDFIESVEMNLEQTVGKIVFKTVKPISMSMIADKVRDAGFSLRYLEAEMNFSQATKIDKSCYDLGEVRYHIVNKSSNPDGLEKIRFIGAKFLSRKDFKKWKDNLTIPCKTENRPVYHVQI